MRASLGVRVLLLMTAVIASLFAVGAAFLSLRLEDEAERLARIQSEDLIYNLEGSIRPRGGVNTARILDWPTWPAFDDSIVVDRNVDEFADRVVAQGVHLNPRGSAHRAPDFDHQAILRALARAMAQGRAVPAAGGHAQPIRVADRVWGACWYRRAAPFTMGDIVRVLFPWFVASTVLLTLANFLVLRRLVIDPVARLAVGARRVRAGDFAFRLLESPRSDEVAVLVRDFNAMAETVARFHQRLENEVADARGRAERAQAAAMTQRRLAAMGEFAAGIAHEINNPLGGLLNAVEVLGREDLDEGRRERYVAILRDGLERIRATVLQLLRFTPRETAVERLDLADVVADAVALVRHRAERLGVELEVAAPPEGEAMVDGARNDLGQAVLNLLGNALDALEERDPAAPGPPRVRIGITVGEEVTLVVADNGPGMSEEGLARAADLFFTTKDVDRGTGLGLSIVHATVDQHGGRVLLSSAPGEGFRVEVVLPRGGGKAARG